MAEEVKKPTTRKKTATKSETAKTTAKTKAVDEAPQTEPVLDVNAMAQQMQQMMALMAQQQQMIMQLQQSTPVTEVNKQAEEEPKKKETKVRRTYREDRGVTKQQLRRKYKGIDIYLTSVYTGSVCYDGRKDRYEWLNYGDVVAVNIDDLLAMEACYLHNPWLVLDDYENDEETLDDIIECLRLESMYRHLYILQELEENINDVDMIELAELVAESKRKGGSLDLDVTTIVQNKIINGELENYRVIAEFEKIVGRMLNK